MSNHVTDPAEHEKIVSLLPWFVNRTLEAHQRQAVLRHIEDCERCQHEIRFLTSLGQTVRADAQESYTAHADVDNNLQRVMNRIDAGAQAPGVLSSGASFLQRILGRISDFSTPFTATQWGATAVIGLFITVLGFQLFYEQPDDRYSVLSSTGIDTASMRLSVKTNPAANQEQIRLKISQEIELTGQLAEIDSRPDGVYILVLKDTIGVAALSELVDKLENVAQIERVEILP